MFDDELAIGRKEIMAFMRCKSWNTVRESAKKYHLPLRRLPDGRPFILKYEVTTYFVTYDELVKENQKKGERK